MTGSEEIAWQLAGLPEVSTGLLGRTHDHETWKTPVAVELDEGNLNWSRRGETKSVEPPRDLLDRFVRLASASDDTVLRFAEKYGVVALCAKHRDPLSNRRHVVADWASPKCAMLGGANPYVPIAWYRGFARWARSILNLAERIHDGNPGGSADWEFVYPGYSDIRNKGFGRSFKPVGLSERDVVQADREVLAQMLDWWLSEVDARLHFQWDWNDPRPRVSLNAGSLPGAIVVSLVFAVGRSGGLAICTSCGIVYSPERQPAKGRRNYCDSDECRKAMRRDTTRASRERKREAELGVS